MMEYKYISWQADTPMTAVESDLNRLGEDGWELISHAQTVYGMSVFLRRLMEPPA